MSETPNGRAYYQSRINFYTTENLSPEEIHQKGLEEVLDFFSKQNKAKLTIIGDGKGKELVKSIAEQYDTIEFLPFTSNKQKLVQLLSSQEYLVLNSKRNN